MSKVFRTAAVLLAAAAAISGALAQVGQKPSPLRKPVRYGMALAPGDPAPTFGGADLDGRRRDVAYDGSAATVVGFWTSACVPCRIQSPALQKLFAERGTAGVQVIGVALEAIPPRAEPTAAKAFLAEHAASYPVLRSTEEIEKAWGGITVLPTTFLISRDGKLLRRYAGADETIVRGLFDDVAATLAGKPLGDQPLPVVPEDEAADPRP